MNGLPSTCSFRLLDDRNYDLIAESSTHRTFAKIYIVSSSMFGILKRLSLSNKECAQMSSPPTPNTSVKATPLSTSGPKIRGTSSSIPSIATFNIFRKKLPPFQPCSPGEPYVAAPGIWSTDATAKAYGYLNTNNKGHELRVQSAEPDIRAAGGKAKRQSVPIGLLGGCKRAQFVERTEQYNTNKVKGESDAPSQLRKKWRGEEGTERGSNWVGVRQRTMRTVSRDDQLVERGANPRTGLVSPFIVSDNGEDCLGGDYIAVAKVGSTDSPSKKRTGSGKWKQDSLGWSLVESPLLSSIDQSVGDKMSRKISTERFTDRVPVDRPGADNIDPRPMTDEQIKQYQEGIARAYKRGGGSIALLDPDTLPSPRQWTPVGPSTPPAKLSKIQRKEVGSGAIRDSKSGDTVIKNAGIRTYSMQTSRKDILERHKVSIIAPSNTPKGSSFESYENASDAIGRKSPFLGRDSRTTCSQTMSNTQPQSCLDPGQAHQNRPNGSESSQSSGLPAASQNRSRHSPPSQILQPSRPASLERSPNSYPTQPRPKVLKEQRRAVEDVCTTTFTTISAKGLRRGRRPKMQRENENDVVPRVNHLSSRCGEPRKGYHQQSTPRNKQCFTGDLPMDIIHTLGLVPDRNQETGRPKKVDPIVSLVNTRCLRETQTRADCLRQMPCEDRPRCLLSPACTTPKPRHKSVNLPQGFVQQKLYGDGCTPTFDHRGDLCDQFLGQHYCHYMVQANLPSELTNGRESMAWLAGNWVDIEEEFRHQNLSTLMLYSEENLAEPLKTLRSIQQLFHQTMCHVTRTLYHALLALTTLRLENATIRDQFRAMKELTLAAVYLLVLLNSLMILREVINILYEVLDCVWHPVQTILRIIGWCIVR